MLMFTEALFSIAKLEKQPKVPIDKWTNKKICTMDMMQP